MKKRESQYCFTSFPRVPHLVAPLPSSPSNFPSCKAHHLQDLDTRPSSSFMLTHTSSCPYSKTQNNKINQLASSFIINAMLHDTDMHNTWHMYTTIIGTTWIHTFHPNTKPYFVAISFYISTKPNTNSPNRNTFSVNLHPW